jgi:hypothetical protein
MAHQLDALIEDTGNALDSPAMGKRIADLSRISEQPRGDAKAVLNHAFLPALTLASAIAHQRAVQTWSATK